MIAPDATPAADPPGPPPGALDPTRGRLAGLALGLGLLAGAASWLGGEAILAAYAADLNPKLRRGEDVEAGRRFAGARIASTSGTYALLGAALGLALGLAGGLARHDARAGAGAGLVGGAVGAVAGASTALVALAIFDAKYDPQSQDLVLPLLTIGPICAAAGAAGGLAFGLGLGGRGRWAGTLAGGLVGAALAVVAYEVVGAVAFPFTRTDLPISQALATRAMLHLMVAGLASLGAALALGLAPRRPAP